MFVSVLLHELGHSVVRRFDLLHAAVKAAVPLAVAQIVEQGRYVLKAGW
jgi:hypothetical protein